MSVTFDRYPDSYAERVLMGYARRLNGHFFTVHYGTTPTTEHIIAEKVAHHFWSQAVTIFSSMKVEIEDGPVKKFALLFKVNNDYYVPIMTWDNRVITAQLTDKHPAVEIRERPTTPK